MADLLKKFRDEAQDVFDKNFKEYMGEQQTVSKIFLMIITKKIQIRRKKEFSK